MSTKKILLVEDDQSLSNAIKRRLESHKYEVVATASGKEAIELVSKDIESFSGIWLDFDVHYYNGLQFMELFTKLDGWKKIPVIIVSNTGDPKKIEDALAIGAKKFFIKAEVRLDDIVEKFLHLVEKKKTTKKRTTNPKSKS